MAPLRRDLQDGIPAPIQKPLRVVASGTLFLTHTLSLPHHPEPSSVIRAQSVVRTRGGSASTCLSILAQFPSVDALLVAPLGGNEEGQMIIRDLEVEKVSTRYCKTWESAGVPTAWVLHADDADTKTVINNNPLPDITHEEFVALLGPVLVPENYAYLNTTSSGPSNSPLHSPPIPSLARPSFSSPSRPPLVNMNSPAPLDWIHFEGRSVKTTMNNLVGLDGLAREKKWRSHCVFSIDVGRRARQGVEALIPHADVIFLNRHYALAHSAEYADSPKAFLLSITHLAPPHALLVAHWGSDGAAVLSVPTREYFQSSGWVDPTPIRPPSPTSTSGIRDSRTESEMESVRTGSGFWAGVGHYTDSSAEYSASTMQQISSDSNGRQASSSQNPRYRNNQSSQQTRRVQPQPRRGRHRSDSVEDDGGDSTDSDDTQIAGGGRGSNGSAARQNAAPAAPKPFVDEVGASDAFIAGMMYALSRRMLPGEPYTPSAVSKDKDGAVTGIAGTTRGPGGGSGSTEIDRGRWRLEECLRFATELAGRKAKMKGWDGLAEQMARAGWFEN